jgi:hypothetical protein
MGGLLRNLAVLAVCSLLGACAGADRPLTLSEFYTFCWPAQVDSFCADDSLCSDFRQYLAEDHQGKADCIKGCRMLGDKKYMDDALQGCDYAITSAVDWCTNYCRRYYDFPQPDQTQASPAQPAQP